MDVDEDVCLRAEGSFPVEPIRTKGALHLATALRFEDLLGGVRLLSNDDRVLANWRAMSLPLA